jgi:hypothetical protein
MLLQRRSVWPAILCLGLLQLLRGQYGLTNAIAVWPTKAEWDNPQTLEIRDLNSLASLTLPYEDPAREVRGRVVGALRGFSSVMPALLRQGPMAPLPASGPSLDLALPSPLTRAPPAA